MSVPIKHRWSLNHNYLAGITMDGWWKLLRQNKFAVDPTYWHRAAFITGMSVLNSLQRRKENKLFGEQVAQTEIKPAPIFILGHWRSGTTHLHNLLSLNSQQFAFANTYQTTNPFTFLTSEEENTKRFAWFLPDTRPMDNIPMTFDSPQEDEFAVLLQCWHSLYLGITFPRREKHYSQYLTFHDTSPEELEEWKSALIYFMKKLTFKYDKPLVLKAPPHTARIRHLLDMFPDAKFVHIHRDPYTIYQSFNHYVDTAMWYTYLQRPNWEQIDESILNRYSTMYNAFFEDKGLIPAGQFHEMAFEDLERDPLGEMKATYNALNLPGFTEFEPKLSNYLDSIKDYKKNCFEPLSEDKRTLVAQRWKRCFTEWGYEI